MERRFSPGVTKDRRRRKGDDVWGKTLRWLGVASWVLMFAYLAMTQKIKPGPGAALDQASRTAANSSLTTYIFLMMILGLGISVAGFLLIQKRNRRTSDEFTYSVLVLGLVSFCGIIYYIFLT